MIRLEVTRIGSSDLGTSEARARAVELAWVVQAQKRDSGIDTEYIKLTKVIRSFKPIERVADSSIPYLASDWEGFRCSQPLVTDTPPTANCLAVII